MMETDMAAGRIVIPNYMPALDLNGNPVSGAKLYFYLNQTTTLTTVYTTSALNVAHPNPVIADAAGVFPSIFADDSLVFSVAITDSLDTPIGGLRNSDGWRPTLDADDVSGLIANKAEKDLSDVLVEDFSNKDFLPADLGTAPGVERPNSERAATAIIVHAEDYGVVVNVSGSAASNTTIINALMAGIAARGGGTLVLPGGEIWVNATLDNKYSGVLVIGAMMPALHDAGTPVYGTTIVPNGAFTVLKHRTPYGASQARNTGGGWAEMRVIGNGVATRLLEVDSISKGTHHLLLTGSVGTEAALYKCGVTGTDLAEAADVQGCSVRLDIRQIDSGTDSADGVVFSGSSNANFSGNFDVDIRGQHKNGHAVRALCADNNVIKVGAFRVSGGTGKTFYGHGLNGSDKGCYENRLSVGGAGGSYFEGTDTSGVTSGTVNIVYSDSANGTPEPTWGTDSFVQTTDGAGYAGGTDYTGMAMGADRYSTSLARAARLSGLPLMIQQTGSGWVRFGDLALEEQSGTQVRFRSVDGDYTGVLFWPDLTTLGVLGYDPSVIAGKTFAGGAAMVSAGYPIGGLWCDSSDGNTVKMRTS